MEEGLAKLKAFPKAVLEGVKRRKAAERIGNFYTAPGPDEADAFTSDSIPFESLPRDVKKHLERAIAPDRRECRLVPGPSGLTTYVVEEEWNDSKEFPRSTIISAFDVFDGSLIGHANYKHMFTRDTDEGHARGLTIQGQTERGFGRRGLGERRLILLDTFSQDTWGIPICSSRNPSKSAMATWEKLRRRGLVDFDEAEGVYRFVPRDTIRKPL
jgi:hypothetical protein